MKFIASTLLILWSSLVYSARPLITDDARIVDKGSCQLEAWSKTTKTVKEYWALPSCNFLGNFEITAGGTKSYGVDNQQWGNQLIQAKTLFKEPSTNDWSIGFAVGQIKTNAYSENQKSKDNYFYIPITQSFNDDSLFLHINIGSSRVANNTSKTYNSGVGLEYQIASKSYLIYEVFQDSSEKLQFQGGVRHWIIPNQVQLDFTYGNKVKTNSSNSWFSIGIRLLSPKWF